MQCDGLKRIGVSLFLMTLLALTGCGGGGSSSSAASGTTGGTAGNTTNNGGVVTTLAGMALLSGSMDGIGSAARFNMPSGIATDAAGNIYVAESVNNTIRKITPAGTVITLAGTALAAGGADGVGVAASFNAPSGVATDTAGNIYVADSGNHTIRKITPMGVVTTLAGTAGVIGSTDGAGAAASFKNPSGLVVDAAGSIYVADSGNNTIRKVTSAGVVTTLAGTAGVGMFGSADGTGAAARFKYPSDIVIDATGNLYVVDSANSIIRKVTSAGVVTTLAGTAGVIGGADGTGVAASFNNPFGLAIDASSNIYVADRGNNTIRKVTSAGVVSTLAGVLGVAGSADGTGTAASFNSPGHLASDTAGNLYVADVWNHTVRKIK